MRTHTYIWLVNRYIHTFHTVAFSRWPSHYLNITMHPQHPDNRHTCARTHTHMRMHTHSLPVWAGATDVTLSTAVDCKMDAEGSEEEVGVVDKDEITDEGAFPAERIELTCMTAWMNNTCVHPPIRHTSMQTHSHTALTSATCPTLAPVYLGLVPQHTQHPHNTITTHTHSLHPHNTHPHYTLTTHTLTTPSQHPHNTHTLAPCPLHSHLLQRKMLQMKH